MQQRELKFRAWVPSGGSKRFEMMPVEEIEWNQDGSIKELNAGYCYSEKYNPDMLQGVILMQYTGLKDKNGKEIYEGDIVAWQGGVHQVLWNDMNTPHWSGVPDSRIEFSAWRDCEVIGNIYENPLTTNKDI